MLEKVDVNKKLGKSLYKPMAEKLGAKLAYLQRECKEKRIPITIVFEGWGASGKGTMISRLIAPLDPRGFNVYSIGSQTEEEKLRPFLWRFWTKTPPKGKIAIFDRSWYQRVLTDRFKHVASEAEVKYAFNEIVNFEEQLVEDGNVIIKFFLHISKEEQKKRFDKLENSKETAWRVTKHDWEKHKDYDKYLAFNNEMLEKTDTSFAPWTIIEATDREFAAVKVLTTVVESLTKALNQVEHREKEENSSKDVISFDHQFKTSVLKGIDLSKNISKDGYKEKLKKLQNKLAEFHNEMYLKRIPLIVAFEGWDAAGKGGAIKRLTQNLDPRGYEVIPISSPNDLENSHHYLWRFWNHVPKAGHIAVFDRTWYGRVLVERIEGFCTTKEWSRAFNEINQMEEQFTNAGCVIVKLWMQIDKDEQEKRFKYRQETPEKQWKITDEDWRNRSKWDQYEEAVDEMLLRTSTTFAPWVVVEANSKPYARIKVLETVVEALEKRLKEIK